MRVAPISVRRKLVGLWQFLDMVFNCIYIDMHSVVVVGGWVGGWWLRINLVLALVLALAKPNNYNFTFLVIHGISYLSLQYVLLRPKYVLIGVRPDYDNYKRT